MTDTQQQASAIVKMPGDQRKAQIIRAATDLFARAGYAGTSLRDVAEMCGMTKAALIIITQTKNPCCGPWSNIG